MRFGIKAFYAQHVISTQAIADAIFYIMAQPDTVDVNEMTIRPTAQEV